MEEKLGKIGRSPRSMMRPCLRLISCFLLMPLLFLFLDGGLLRSQWPLATVAPIEAGKVSSTSSSSSSSKAPHIDRLLGGLLSPDFEEASCLSRYQAVLYRKASPYAPSYHLTKRLREYEALHRRCAPHTTLYNRSIAHLHSGNAHPPTDCNYVVWIPHNGLGNRILTIVSAFLYALLNHRVLLLHVTPDMADLLCEPFPGTSWVLPSDFPLHNLRSFDAHSPQRYGHMLRHNLFFSSHADSLPAYVYLHLPWYYDEWDKRFFCPSEQRTLLAVPWLLLKSDHYFVPSLFTLRVYDSELQRLFPERSTAFHHLVRYLVHPSNAVWGRATRYYRAHLASADERVGIQIRVFDNFPVPFEKVLRQIMNCSLGEGILPAVREGEAAPEEDASVKAVFVTSLHSGFSDRIGETYYSHATATGEVVGVHQASHDEQQQTEWRGHNVKALAEMELLSFSDVLITTAWSTFGYVAQGLGGLRPWILLRSTQSELACRRAASSEPCFLMPPPRASQCLEGGAGVEPHLRRCEDEIGGIKLFD